MGSKVVALKASAAQVASTGHAEEAHRIPLRHRRTKFDFSAVPAYWLGGDAFLTRFIDAMSINFPDGERFFMDSVRNYASQVTDPKLSEDIKLFIRQEAQHGHIHDLYNEMIAAQGVNVEGVIKQIKTELALAQKYLPKKVLLAMTAAAEHLTATLGEGLLELSPEILGSAHPQMRALYAWHAAEEVEHKAVAFDVYQKAADGDYATRALALVAITLLVHLKVAMIMNHMFKVDGVTGKPLVVARGIWKMYGPNGIFTKLAPRFFAWFKPGFHPWDTALPPVAATWIAEYEKHQDPKLAADVAFARHASAAA